MAVRKGRPPRTKRAAAADGSFTVHGRAAPGHGSVFYVEAEDTWRASYTLVGDVRTTKNGRSVQRVRYVRGRTQEEAIERRKEAIARAELDRGLTKFTRATTVSQLATWWLETVAKVRVRPSSLAAIRDRLTPARLGELSTIAVVDLTSEQVAAWQAALMSGPKPLSPKTVADTRSTLRQVIESAVDHGLVTVNVVAKVKAPRRQQRPGRILEPADTKRLLAATDQHRLGPAIAMLFLQGWRVSEVLGLAWSDVDLDEGYAIVRRAVVEVKGEGRRLGPPKTQGAEGRHELLPGVVTRLRRWKETQDSEREAAGEWWERHRYERQLVDIVFTQPTGALVGRQAVDKVIRSAGERLGLDRSTLGTHVGRRSVVTALYAAGESIEDIARHVGHSSTTTTAGYVATLGSRPKRTAQRAAELLDEA